MKVIDGIELKLAIYRELGEKLNDERIKELTRQTERSLIEALRIWEIVD